MCFCVFNFIYLLDQSCDFSFSEINIYFFHLVLLFYFKRHNSYSNMLYCYWVKETFTLIIERLFNNNLNFIIFFIKSLNFILSDYLVGRVQNYRLK